MDWLLYPSCAHALVPLIRLYEHAIPHPTPQRDISTSYSTVKLKCSVEVICRSHHTLVSVFSRRGVGWVGSGSSNPANVSQSYQQFSRLSLLFITISIKRQIKEETKGHFTCIYEFSRFQRNTFRSQCEFIAAIFRELLPKRM